MKKGEKLEELVLNKNLIVDEEAKKVITSAERGRYDYFDFSKEIIQQIASKDIKDTTVTDARCIVQALFPKYLICSGLFDAFLMFEIKNGVRVDPPKYYYNNVNSYLNNNSDKKFNKLSLEIKNLFEQNNIDYHESWDKIFKEEN